MVAGARAAAATGDQEEEEMGEGARASAVKSPEPWGVLRAAERGGH